MKSLKFLTIIALLAFFANTQKVLAQGSDIDLLKEQIEAKKNEISVNEEILISGISALKRVNVSLQELKDKQASREEIARKQKVVSSVQKRLSNLKSLIQVKKTELAPLESKLLRKTKLNVGTRNAIRYFLPCFSRNQSTTNGYRVLSNRISDIKHSPSLSIRVECGVWTRQVSGVLGSTSL